MYISGIGWIPVEVTGSANFTPPDMSKKPIVIKAYSASKQYDGLPCGTWENDKYSIVYGTLMPGHTLSVTVNETGRDAKAPGTYANEITQAVIYDENGKDVTKEYYTTVLVDGETTVKKRKLTIGVCSASKVYDGLPLTCDQWYILSGSLPPNTVLTMSGLPSITNIGTEKNEPLNVRIYEHDSNGNQTLVNNCYEITVISGTLKVTEE